MNIFEKIQKAKGLILKANLKKSGRNTFAGYTYYELADILPTIVKICDELKLFTKINFTDEFAVLEIINTEKPDEKIEYTSPMKELSLKGANAIQALGGVQTYQRRYLYMCAFDIIENDMFDGATQPMEETSKLERLNDAIQQYALKVAQPEVQVKKALLAKMNVKKVSDLTDEQIEALIKKLS